MMTHWSVSCAVNFLRLCLFYYNFRTRQEPEFYFYHDYKQPCNYKNGTYQRWEHFHCWLGVRGDVLGGVQQQLSHSILCGYNLSNANSGGVRTVCKNKQQKCMYIRQMLTCGGAEQRLSTQPQEGLDSRNTKWYLFFYQRTNPLTNSKQIICRNVLVQNHLEKMMTLITK